MASRAVNKLAILSCSIRPASNSFRGIEAGYPFVLVYPTDTIRGTVKAGIPRLLTSHILQMFYSEKFDI